MDTDRKPFLSFEDQILHLKKKGITFNKVSEFDAKNYLKNNNNFFKRRFNFSCGCGHSLIYPVGTWGHL